MSAFKLQVAAFVCSILSLGCYSVFGQEGGGINLTINNDTSDNLLVTIYDMGVSPRQTILSNRVLAQQSVGVLVGAPLPGTAGVTEVVAERGTPSRPLPPRSSRGLSSPLP